MTDMRVKASDLETKVMNRGRQLLDLVQQAEAASKPANKWLDKLLDRIMEDESFRIQALRFVDVLPSLKDDRELVGHLKEYFGDDGLPLTGLVRWGMRTASSGMANTIVAKSIRKVMQELARRYMGGANPTEALQTAQALRERGINFSLDLLGEATISEVEADAYQQGYFEVLNQLPSQVQQWPANPVLDEMNGHSAPALNVSLKLSSLYSQINHLSPQHSIDMICERLRPILLMARDKGAFVYVDMEQYQFKQIILDCFKQILMEPGLRDWPDVGIAMQAYLLETESDIQALADWARERGTAVSVRLVRGAYWDYETVIAEQQGWPSPVWMQKWQTDASYERCMHLLFANHPHLVAALGTHNVRSIALGMVLAEEYALNPSQYEFQMLYGMARSMESAIPSSGHRLRIYVPIGDLLPGMAYLVRRLLENSSSQSFQRLRGQRQLSYAQLLASPHADITPLKKPRNIKAQALFINEPIHQFVQEEQRLRFQQALQLARLSLGTYYPLGIGEFDKDTGSYQSSVNPARPSELIGKVSVAGMEQADEAVERANRVFPEWSASSAESRAAILQKVAGLLRERRDEFAAYEVLEAGKGWQEADANISEAIDFLEYYAAEAQRLAQPQRFDVAGEANYYSYQALGVGVIISPWNFPLAILVGMLSAAIVAGNTAILKPSSQTPVIAARFFSLLREAGLPDGVVEFLAGPGDSLGDYLVSHAQIHFIAFTGSRSVGQRILRQAADVKPGQTHIKRVILEMGGKNAVIIDSDADLDDAIPGVIQSAFGYQGQKCSACSRVIVVGDGVYQSFIERLVDATRSLSIGVPEDPQFRIGPVISRSARENIEKAIEQGKQVASVALEMKVPAGLEGHFIGPLIFRDVAPHLPLARDEIFGPVLVVMQAENLQQAIQLANDNTYALTGGIYSRSPENIDLACETLQAGNLYINRRITGALVNRQPFGGFKLSGTGSKTGGPDYLLQFMTPRTITENTLRRGFAPSLDRQEYL